MDRLPREGTHGTEGPDAAEPGRDGALGRASWEPRAPTVPGGRLAPPPDRRPPERGRTGSPPRGGRLPASGIEPPRFCVVVPIRMASACLPSHPPVPRGDRTRSARSTGRWPTRSAGSCCTICVRRGASPRSTSSSSTSTREVSSRRGLPPPRPPTHAPPGTGRVRGDRLRPRRRPRRVPRWLLPDRGARTRRGARGEVTDVAPGGGAPRDGRRGRVDGRPVRTAPGDSGPPLRPPGRDGASQGGDSNPRIPDYKSGA